MALTDPTTVRSLTLSSTFARFDAFTHREFSIRRQMAEATMRPKFETGLSAPPLILIPPWIATSLRDALI